MKILAIRIKNLASLEGRTDIDFTQEPLRSAGIFAITGPTGAGKSTVLDALCLALYDKTPRYAQAREIGIEITDVQGNTINQSDVRAILRDGAGDGYAEVDFLGIDGQHYRANWSVRRARNKADGRLQQAVITLKDLTTGNDIGGKKTELLGEISRLVGLSYEQFIRSVLLAQGDFTAFLKADKDQKASLLEKLTGTHIYSELSKKIFERHRQEQQQLNVLQQRSEGIKILTTEELAALNEWNNALTKTLEELNQQIDATDKELKWHEDLSQCELQVEEAGRSLEEKLFQQDQSAAREAYLRRVKQVQPIRANVDAVAESTELLAKRQETLGELNDQKLVRIEKVNGATVALTEAKQQLDTSIQTQEATQPQLDEAKKIDVQLQGQETEVDAAKQRLQNRQRKWEESKQLLAETQQGADALERQITQHRQWIEKHAARQPIAENHTLIVTRLAEGNKHLKVIDQAVKHNAEYQSQLQVATKEHEEASQHSGGLRKEVQELRVAIDTLSENLKAVPIGQLREESKDIADQLEELYAATHQWRLLDRLQRDAAQLQHKTGTCRRELTEKETELQEAITLLKASDAQRKTSAAMLEKAMIAASADVETLRNQLADGQPCPVCGSETHPYAHENPQLNHVLDELRRSHDAVEREHETQVTRHSRLAEAVPQLQQTLEQLRSDLAAKELEVREQTERWERYAISQRCAGIAPAQKESWLSDHAQQLNASKEKIEAQLDRYQHTQDQITQLQQRLQRLQTEQATSADATKDLAHRMQRLKEGLDRTKDDRILAKEELDEVLEAVQAYFPDDQWVDNWRNHADAFLQNIKDFAERWTQTTRSLETDDNRAKVLQATIARIDKEEKEIAVEAAEAERDYVKKHTALEQLRKRRLSLFAGQAVEAVELRLKQRVVEAQEKYDTQLQATTDLQTQQAQLDTQITERGREVLQLETRIADRTGQLDQWLDDFNANQDSPIDREALQSLLLHPMYWITQEQKALSEIDRAVTQAVSIQEERIRRLTDHQKNRPSDTPLDDLRPRLGELQDRRIERLREQNEIGFQLKQDDTNKQDLGDLLTTIQAQQSVVDNWSKLNEIIGSSDGKKFRQAAQEYTLDILLNYANVHLTGLSNRYRLQRIPGTLGLQVLDQDMGDEIRTVYSLSGGESFLVSLALALGLASLSASRMNVESLFIDEGFGALDPNTLNIAMDALERLHNQGRKVGVISHVQEMTERIPVQIKVVKEQSGRSGVEVVG